MKGRNQHPGKHRKNATQTNGKQQSNPFRKNKPSNGNHGFASSKDTPRTHAVSTYDDQNHSMCIPVVAERALSYLETEHHTGVVPIMGLSFCRDEEPSVAATVNERRIKNLPMDERPREKLSARGLFSLTDCELLALLLATGTRQKSAIELSRDVLDQMDGLNGLGNSDLPSLLQLDGIGEAKASIIMAAFELGRRRQLASKAKERYTLPSDIAEYLRPRLAQQPEEVFKVLFMDNANHILAERDLFKGGLSGVSVDPRVIFRLALQFRCTRIVLSHNHPSGDVSPSEEDCHLTQNVIRLGEIMDIKLIDHLILSDWGYYSMADEGLLSRLRRSDWSFRSFAGELRAKTPQQKTRAYSES